MKKIKKGVKVSFENLNFCIHKMGKNGCTEAIKAKFSEIVMPEIFALAKVEEQPDPLSQSNLYTIEFCVLPKEEFVKLKFILEDYKKLKNAKTTSNSKKPSKKKPV